jgi:hypothetical protein
MAALADPTAVALAQVVATGTALRRTLEDVCTTAQRQQRWLADAFALASAPGDEIRRRRALVDALRAGDPMAIAEPRR